MAGKSGVLRTLLSLRSRGSARRRRVLPGITGHARVGHRRRGELSAKEHAVQGEQALSAGRCAVLVQEARRSVNGVQTEEVGSTGEVGWASKLWVQSGASALKGRWTQVAWETQGGLPVRVSLMLAPRASRGMGRRER